MTIDIMTSFSFFSFSFCVYIILTLCASVRSLGKEYEVMHSEQSTIGNIFALSVNTHS